MMLKKALMMAVSNWLFFGNEMDGLHFIAYILMAHRVFKVKLSSQCSDVTYHQRNRIPHQVHNLVRSVMFMLYYCMPMYVYVCLCYHCLVKLCNSNII